MKLRARALLVPLVLGASMSVPLVSTQSVSAAGVTYSFPAPPIASAGSIGPGQSVAFPVRAMSNGLPVAGSIVYVRYQGGIGSAHVAGDVTAVPPAQCNGQTQLPTSGSPIPCTTDSNGQVMLTYIAPAQPPAQGRADWLAQDSASSPHTQAITHYVYTTVYRFNPSPIAPGGSLAAGASVPVALTAEDGLNHGISGSAVYVSFTAAAGGGSAMVGTTKLTATPALFTADTTGIVRVTYTAPTIRPSTGQDAIAVQDSNASRPTEVNTDSYSFAAAVPVLSVGDQTVVEGDQIPGIPAKFTVTISAPQPNPVTVQYVTLCGVGDKGCGEDFIQVFAPITVTIPANATSTSFIVRQFAYIGANEGETYNEGWFVELLHPSIGVVGRAVGTGVLLPDVESGGTAFPNLSVGDAGLVPSAVAGGNPVWFTVTLGTQQSAAVTVSYATTDGTAVAGTDYAPATGVALIPAGKTSAVIKVMLLPNGAPAANKTFTLTISNPSGGLTIARAAGAGTILAG